MVFSSLEFLCFFLPVVLLVNLCLRNHIRLSNVWLLMCSLLFYGISEPSLFFIFFAMILVNYAFGCWIDHHAPRQTPQGERGNRLPLVLSVLFNLGMLVYFKYTGFFGGMLNGVLVRLGMVPLSIAQVVMPIGISFFTFQTLSYLIDLYWRKVPVQKNPLKLALYISLFPQLVAGPIVRYADVNREIDRRRVDAPSFYAGIVRFCLGLVKKVLIANQVAVFADLAFGLAPQFLHPIEAWAGLICYSLQIYFDFSAYSDMAIGMGQMMGFHFLENFHYPYIAHSIQDFWRRWHISLSTFFRDYVYIPLGGNRKGKARTYFNSFVVFFLCGLWHGASWNFVLWGVMHGLLLTVEKIPPAARFFARLPRVLRHLYTLLMVMIAWVFFRADTLPAAGAYLRALVGGFPGTQKLWLYPNQSVPQLLFFTVLGILFSMPLYPWLRRRPWGRHLSAALLLLLCVICMFVLATTGYNPFIYFRF